MVCPQHQSAVNGRKHVFLSQQQPVWICGKAVLSSLVITSFFSVLLSLAAGPYLWMGGPIAPSTPESDLWDAVLLFGQVTPQKRSTGSALEWNHPSRRTAGPETAVSALTAFLKQAALC